MTVYEFFWCVMFDLFVRNLRFFWRCSCVWHLGSRICCKVTNSCATNDVMSFSFSVRCEFGRLEIHGSSTNSMALRERINYREWEKWRKFRFLMDILCSLPKCVPKTRNLKSPISVSHIRTLTVSLIPKTDIFPFENLFIWAISFQKLLLSHYIDSVNNNSLWRNKKRN